MANEASAQRVGPRRRRGALAIGVRLAVVGVGIGILVFLFRSVDWASTWGYLRRLGPFAPLVLVPYLFVLVFDSLGWLTTIARSRVSFLRLLRIRAATEAVLTSLPAGVAVAEPLRTVLLQRVLGLTLADATASVIVSKIAIALAQGGFLVLGVALAQHWAAAGNGAHPPGTGWAGAATAITFLVIMGGLLLAIVRGRLAMRVLGWIRAMGRGRWHDRLARMEHPLEELDHALGLLARVSRRRVAKALGFFFLAWVSLAVEDWLILQLLGPQVPFSSAVAMEATASVVRIGFFFMPGGLGGQEASYYGFLRLCGVPNAEAIAAAFVIVKRAKELVWIAIGYAVLAYLPARPGDSPEAEPTESDPPQRAQEAAR